MPYISRDADGRIDGLHRSAPHAGSERLPSDHAEVLAFLGTGGQVGFSRLDADFVRVIEDVIDTLIARHVINITDLPDEAQAKLFARKSYRERAGRNALKLFDDASPADLIDDSRLSGLG